MDLNPQLEIQLAAQIMSGLLASGHYTQPNIKGSEFKHLIRRANPGEDWQAAGARCSLPAYVVDDALLLLAELNLGLASGAQPQINMLRPQKKPEPKPVVARKKKAVGKKRKK